MVRKSLISEPEQVSVHVICISMGRNGQEQFEVLHYAALAVLKKEKKSDMRAMIRNLIFDVGSVLIGYRWKEMLTMDFGIEDSHAEEIGHRLFEDSIWEDYDRGTVDTDELLDHYSGLYPDDSATIKRMILEGERMMVRRDTLWKRIEKLKEQGFKIFILSNYSEFLFKKHTEPIPFMDKLDGMVVSYEVNMLKPEPGIYEHLLKKYSLVPAECLFFDDRRENVDAAIKAGIHSIQVTSEEMLVKELETSM